MHTTTATHLGTRYALALSGAGTPTSAHAADLDTLTDHGFARSLCGRTVSVDHLEGTPVAATPIGTDAAVVTYLDVPHGAAAWVGCLACSRRLEALAAVLPASVLGDHGAAAVAPATTAEVLDGITDPADRAAARHALRDRFTTTTDDTAPRYADTYRPRTLAADALAGHRFAVRTLMGAGHRDTDPASDPGWSPFTDAAAALERLEALAVPTPTALAVMLAAVAAVEAGGPYPHAALDTPGHTLEAWAAALPA